MEIKLKSVQKSNKKAQICQPDLFPRRSIFGGHFRERMKSQQKRPKFASQIYFHTAEVYLEEILESVRKSNKKGPNLLTRFIFTQMYIWKFKRIFVAVFTSFAATLARQPSAASLAPRSKNMLLKIEFFL